MEAAASHPAGPGPPSGAMRVAARAILFAGAVAVVLWLGGNLRAIERENAATATLGNAKDEAAFRQGEHEFDRATAFASDPAVRLQEAATIVFTGNPRRAVPIAREVTRREPENFSAWLTLATAARDSDPGLARRAERRARALNPSAVR
jgi:predicted Zn-dependent protease